MNTAQDVIAEAVAILHKDCLKVSGFSKSGSTWVRLSEWPQLVNLQLMSSNTRTAAKATFNLGVSVPPIGAVLSDSPPPALLKEYDCELGVRIGLLLPSKSDYWWSVTTDTEPSVLAREFREAIEEFALPWFEQMTTLDAVAEEFSRRGRHSSAAVAHALAGRQELASTMFIEAISSAQRLAQPKLRRLAARLSLDITSPQP